MNKYIKLDNIPNEKCTECKITKIKRNSHNKILPRADNILEVIHADLIGLIKNSNQYILT